MPRIDAAVAQALRHGRFRCDNDMVCGWAGSLAGTDGINVIAALLTSKDHLTRSR